MPEEHKFIFKADWTKGNNNPKLMISCPGNPDDARTFYEQFKKLSEGRMFSNTLSIDASGVITIDTSNGRGTPGAHLGPISGGLVVNFMSPVLRDLFVLYFKELKDEHKCQAPFFGTGTGSLYFHNDIPTPEQQKEIDEHYKKIRKEYPYGVPNFIDVHHPSFNNHLLGPAIPDAEIKTKLTPFTKEEFEQTVAKAPEFTSDAVSWVGHGMAVIMSDHEGKLAQVPETENSSSWDQTVSNFFDGITQGLIKVFEFMKDWIVNPVVSLFGYNLHNSMAEFSASVEPSVSNTPKP